ncbi:MAG: Cellulose-binding domain protein [Polyangiaceae bacterium]|nr:Cellulose-binding domain protein [Polyangiaceae bacterium]
MKARLAIALSLVLGCGRTSTITPTPSTAGGSASTPGPVGAGAGMAGTAGTAEVPPTCDASQGSASPLAALNDVELSRSVRAVLLEPAPPRESPEKHIGFEPVEHGPSSALALHERAHAIALRVSQSAPQLLELAGCSPVTSEEEQCRGQFLDRFLRRAFRRPVTDEDRSDMGVVFDRGRELGGDFASGARAVIEVALQSPEFLYLVEQGNGVVRGSSTELTSHEVAARLSYFLTGAPPDDELAAIANLGTFDAVARREQAERLIGSEPNRRQVQALYERWFSTRYAGAEDDASFPPELAAAAVQETRRFIDDVTFDGAGTFRALLTEPSTWVNEPLARLYGNLEVSGDEFQKIALDPRERGGIFTQPGFLRAGSRSNETDPIWRGNVVLSALLCVKVPPPPDVSPVPPPVTGATRRAMFEALTAGNACQSCHRDLNGAGFPFESYDAFGRFRDTENGAPIDASGELFAGNSAGKVGNALEMMVQIAQSETARECFVTHWLEQSRRRAATPEDACALDRLKRAFAETDGNVTELMLQIATSPELGLRPNRELAP